MSLYDNIGGEEGVEKFEKKKMLNPMTTGLWWVSESRLKPHRKVRLSSTVPYLDTKHS